ncbi:MAG TPA: DMT family transporter [Usitatibacteraceae bacterium]|nr:DMT family transporter [Usitatibacteraceae bacterium]
MTSSWMLVAGALFAAMGSFAKAVGDQFSGAELAMYRALFGLVAIGAFVLWRGETVRTRFAWGHFWRGFTGTISLVAYFYAMTQLPLATAITLNYTSPIFLTLLSTIALGERPNARLIGAVALGMVGAALVLRPTFAGDQAGVGLLGLASGFFAALAYVNVKKLGDAGEPEWRVVFYFSLAGVIGGALVQAVLGQFHPVTGGNLGWLLGVGAAATIAQLAMTRAYHSGNTVLVGVFAYSTVVFSAFAGWLFFGETLPPIAWLGVAVVIVSGLVAKGATKTEAPRRPALPAEED